MRSPNYRRLQPDVNNGRTQFTFWFTLFTVVSLAALLAISLTALITSFNNQNPTCPGGSCVNGTSATIAIGVTTTLPCTELATVNNSGSATNAILNFAVPEGCPGQNGQNANVTVSVINNSNNTNVTQVVYNTTDFNIYINITENETFISLPGPPGPPGPQGPNGTCESTCVNGTNGVDGVTPTVTIGTTVTTLPGTNATVSNDGNATDLILNFTIPEGAPGSPGSPGQNANVTITIINSSNNTSVTETIYNTSDFNVFINITENATFISTPGPPGPAGTNGTCTPCNNGTDGVNGIDGTNGTSTSFSIGNTTTTNPGTLATVVNVGTVDDVILNFEIPAGFDGINGTNGVDGVNPSITVGSTETTLPGTNATVTNNGNATDIILNFTIPEGAVGSTGSPGRDANVTITIINSSNNTDVTGTIYNTSDFNIYINITENATFISTPGPPGSNGTDGTNGIDGVNGTNGADGAPGINGTNGIDGVNGTNGVDGAPGINGTNGINGVNGTNGADGVPGINGTNGINGVNGTNGINGINGVNGTNGVNGVNGINGTNGINGINGTNGINGVNGTSGGTNLKYFTNISLSGSRTSSSYAVLNSLTITTNGIYYFIWEGVVTLVSGSSSIQVRISKPAGTEQDNSYRKSNNNRDNSLVTSAIFTISDAPTTVFMEWALTSTGTFSVAKNSFRAIAVGTGAVV